MILRFRRPSPPLDQFVTLLTYHRGYNPAHGIERLLPDGGINLIVDLTDRPKHVFDNDRLVPVQTFERSWIAGVRTELISISSGNDSDMLVLSFPPWGAAAFTNVPMNELADTVIPAEYIWARSVDRLRERVGEAAHPEAVFLAAEAWLRENFHAPHNGFPLTRAAAQAILERPAMTSIDRVVSDSGVSHKHLISLFSRYVGITPKRLQRVRRFQSVVEEVERIGDVDWTSLALDCGFYDQAHLIREFRKFSGLTPTRYLEARGEMINYLPVSGGR